MTYGLLHIEVVRATGEMLGGQRDLVHFAMTIGQTTSKSYPTTKKKRGYVFDFMRTATSTATIEWNERIGPLILEEDESVLSVEGFKGGSQFGRVKVSLQSLPLGEEVAKWFQLHDQKRRNVNALVFLKLKLVSRTSPENKSHAVELKKGSSFKHKKEMPDPKRKENGVAIAEGDREKLNLLPSRLSREDNLGTGATHGGLTSSQSRRAIPIIDQLCVVGISKDKYDDIIQAKSEDVTIHPELLLNYPELNDVESTNFSHSLPAMIFYPPYGRPVLSKTKRKAVCYSLFMSNSQTYVTTLIFWHPIGGSNFLLPMAWCLVSRKSFDHQHRLILATLYEAYIEPLLQSTSVPTSMELGIDTHGIAIEQYLLNMIDECPELVVGEQLAVDLPLQRTVQFRLQESVLDLPLLEHSIVRILGILDIETVMTMIGCILTGSSILIHSSQVSLLFSISETLLMLCFPFQWPNIYVPVLPESLLPIIESPVPFLVGTVSSLLKRVQIRPGIVLLDVDHSTIECSTSLPHLPLSATNNLRRGIRQITHAHIFNADDESARFQQYSTRPILQRAEENVEITLQKEFLKYIADLLKDYREYLLFDNSDRPVFDEIAFLQHRHDAQPFLSRLIRTQLFLDFLELHRRYPNYLYDYVFYVLDDEQVPDTLKPTSSVKKSAFSSKLSEQEKNACEMLRDKENYFFPILLPCPVFRVKPRRLRTPDSFAVGDRPKRYISNLLLAKSKREERKNSSMTGASRLHDVIQKLLAGKGCSFAELSSVSELLRLGVWRDIVAKLLKNRILKLTYLPTEAFDDLVFMIYYLIDQCYQQRDFQIASSILDISNYIYTESQDRGKKVYLRDTIKEHKLWRSVRYWSYCLTVHLLSHPERYQGSGGSRRRFSFPDTLSTGISETQETNLVELASRNLVNETHLHRSATQTSLGSISSIRAVIPNLVSPSSLSDWQDFVFSSICTILCTMQTLDVEAETSYRVVARLAEVQELDDSQNQDMVEVFRNVYQVTEIPSKCANGNTRKLHDSLDDNDDSKSNTPSDKRLTPRFKLTENSLPSRLPASPQRISQQRRLHRELLSLTKADMERVTSFPTPEKKVQSFRERRGSY